MRKVLKTGIILSISLMTLISIAGDKLPTVMIIGTGGTIAGKADSATTEVYKPGQIKVEDLVASVHGLDKLADLKFKQLFNIASCNITTQDLILLANTVNAVLEGNDVSGIVITHGTDTIEETAFFLDLTVKSSKPVIITGSMRPATSISADGPMNLYDAVAVAASKEAAGKGVLLVFDDKIYDARNVSKISSDNTDAFNSPNSGPIGTAVDGEVKFYYQPLRKHTVETPFDVKNVTELPQVLIIYDYSCSTPELIQSAINLGVKGIVFAGTGNGSVNENAWKLLDDARKKGIIIVRSSRTGAGNIEYDSLDGLDTKFGLIPADNLNPQKARILLMLALTKTSDIKTISGYFKMF